MSDNKKGAKKSAMTDVEPKDMFVFLDIDETFISSQAMEDGFSLAEHKKKAERTMKVSSLY